MKQPGKLTWGRALASTWANTWSLSKTHQESWWLGQLLCALIGAGFGAGVVMLAALLSGNLLRTAWWIPNLLLSMQLGSLIALLSSWSLRLVERALPAATLARINEGLDARSLLVFVGLPSLCSVLSLVLLDTWYRWQRLGTLTPLRLPDKGTLITFLFCGALFSGLSLWRMRAQLRAQKAQSQLSDAQLRLLQAQIEPHFLFNTLANVQGLIDYEPAQAKRMLDAFTDYLRASLLQMRAQDVSLRQELELVSSYLTVMQCRMGERLRTQLEVPEALLEARIPPLLLQPLVENAVHHGLEPQLAGGLLKLSAQAQGAGLCIEIADNGIGLARSRLRPRKGHGMALQNIRERLQAIYGSGASLELLDAPQGSGTLARLTLPQLRPFDTLHHA